MPENDYVQLGDDKRLGHYGTGGWLGHVLYGKSPYSTEQGLEKASPTQSILADALGDKDYYVTAYDMSQMNETADTSPANFLGNLNKIQDNFQKDLLLNSTFEKGGKYLEPIQRRNFFGFFTGLKILSAIGPKFPDLVLSALYYGTIRLGDRLAQSSNPIVNGIGRFFFSGLLGGTLALAKTLVRPFTSTLAALFSPITAGLGFLYGAAQYAFGDTNVKPRIMWDGFIEGLKAWGGDVYNTVVPQSKVVNVTDKKNQSVKSKRINNFTTNILFIAVAGATLGVLTIGLLANPIGAGLIGALATSTAAGLMAKSIFNGIKHAINDIKHWGNRESIHNWEPDGSIQHQAKKVTPPHDPRRTNKVIPIDSRANPKAPQKTTQSWELWAEAVNRVAVESEKIGIKVPIAGISVLLDAHEYNAFNKSTQGRALPTRESSQAEVEYTLALVQKALMGLAADIPSPAAVMKTAGAPESVQKPGDTSSTPKPGGGT